jgi:hypothetical protein
METPEIVARSLEHTAYIKKLQLQTLFYADYVKTYSLLKKWAKFLWSGRRAAGPDEVVFI